MKNTYRIKTLIPLLLAVWFLNGCGAAAEQKEADKEQTVFDICTTQYSQEQLKEIAQFRGALEDLDRKYPIEYSREAEDGLRVAYLGDGYVTVVPFNLNLSGFGGYGLAWFGMMMKLEGYRDDYLTVTGRTLKEIEEAFPGGFYAYFELGSLPEDYFMSMHCTLDGYYITIHYDGGFCVKDVECELI